MPGQAPTVGDERQTRCGSSSSTTKAHILAVAFGLTDEQARSKPTVSALSIGGLIKHATGVQQRLDGARRGGARLPAAGHRPMEEIMADLRGRVRDARRRNARRICWTSSSEQNAETLRIFAEPTWIRRCRCRSDVPWFPKDIDHWIGALGDPPPDRGAGPARRPRRHHPRIHRRRNAVRTDGRRSRTGRRPTGSSPGSRPACRPERQCKTRVDGTVMQTRSGTAVCGESSSSMRTSATRTTRRSC